MRSSKIQIGCFKHHLSDAMMTLSKDRLPFISNLNRLRLCLKESMKGGWALNWLDEHL